MTETSIQQGKRQGDGGKKSKESGDGAQDKILS